MSSTGCGPYKSVSVCPTDFDLAELTGDETSGYNILYTGAKTGDSCDPANRPTSSNAEGTATWGYERQ